MTRETIAALTDAQLVEVGAWTLEESQARGARRRQEIISKIKQLAADAGVSVTIEGARGRQRKAREGNKQK
jgi:hypothetical protein